MSLMVSKGNYPQMALFQLRRHLLSMYIPIYWLMVKYFLFQSLEKLRGGGCRGVALSDGSSCNLSMGAVKPNL